MESPKATRNQCFSFLHMHQMNIKKYQCYPVIRAPFLSVIICLFSLGVHVITQFSVICDLN